MDDSGLSFFDDPDFNFAKDEQDEQNKRNRISFNFFASEVLEDAELTGYIYIDIPKCLRAGSIFLRIETTEELFLAKKDKNHYLIDQLVVLREKILNEMALTDNVKPTQGKDKKNMVAPVSLKSNLKSSDNLLLNKEGEETVPVRTSYTKCILDVEAFVLDYEVSKPTVLVLPFRIQLKGKLSKTCDLIIDTTPYISQMKKKYVHPIKKITVEGKVESNLKKVLNTSFPQSENSQRIKLTHKFMVYYGTKNDIHNFNQVQIEISEEEKNKIRYEALQKSDYFMSADKEFKVVPNFKQINYKKHNRRGDATITHENPLLLCCTQNIKLEINICLDLINLRNQDTSLNFVMSFDKRIVDSYLSLDVVIYSRLTQIGDEGESNYITENTCMLHSFDLDDKKMPRSSMGNKLEFVQKLDLTLIQGKYQSINCDHVKLEYFIKFYLSSLKYRLTLEILEIPLNFLRIASDFSSQENEEIEMKFETVEERIKKTKIGVMLPYALIDFNLNVRGNGFVPDEVGNFENE